MRKDDDSCKLRSVIRTFILCVFMALSLFADDKAAAGYLDGRFTWWTSWPSAARDHGTFCVSCNTVLPYALARPTLRAALAEQNVSPAERKLLDNVVKRVRMWNDVAPFYPSKATDAPRQRNRGARSRF